MKEVLDTFGMWLWLIFISIVGGILGFLNRNDLSSLPFKTKCRSLFLGIATSMFVAYLVFEFTFFVFGKEALSVASAGLAAYMGTNALVALENVFISYIGRLKK